MKRVRYECLTGDQNMTGPGRPGREDQASLSLMAAQAVGWDYSGLLARILGTAMPLPRYRPCGPSSLPRDLCRIKEAIMSV